MLAGLPYTVLRETALARPTMAEGLGFLFSNENPVARIDDAHTATRYGALQNSVTWVPA